MANEAWRGRGRLHVRCATCSSTGTPAYAETLSTAQGNVVTETLVKCPWCETPTNVVVQELPEALTYPNWT